MQLPTDRKNLRLYGDHTRVIGRFFWAGKERAVILVQKIIDMDKVEARNILMRTLRDFARRHRNIMGIWTRHLSAVKERVPELREQIEELSENKQALIGAYFTHEYSIESAAFFNPSIVPALDQSDLRAGELRAVMSMRAVGEGHVSSIVFRNLIISADHHVEAEKVNEFVSIADDVHYKVYRRADFRAQLSKDGIVDQEVVKIILERLPEQFNYITLYNKYRELINSHNDQKNILDKVLRLGDVYYEGEFDLDTDISERVLYPMLEYESRGMEDARFLQFTKEDGSTVYYGTYTAYNGFTIRPMLVETHNFYDFKIRPIYGNATVNKNHAIFPRKINGHYYVLARIDGINNYIIKSDKLQEWNDAQLLMTPKYYWEMYQMGNCGAPIETDRGWLMITHGVGTMRKYSIGAALLDLDDPTKVIGRLEEPLLSPLESEREGYVPNVLYSCGSLIHNGKLFLPFGISDEAASFASVDVDQLLDAMV
jgi:predicted GH43/DUF377 family glycosyl hydrolase